MREQWNTANSLLLISGDSIHGQIAALLENENEARDYPLLAESPNGDEAVRALPKRWETTRDLIAEVSSRITQAREDFKIWMDGADLDDALKAKLKADSNGIVDSMCSALTDAREYYGAAGGYRNDLTFILISDKGDRPCQNVAMSHPYSTTVRRRALVTIAESTNELPEANNEKAFLHDNAGFVVASGTTVRVIGHRYIDNIELTMCQVHGGGGTGWLPCSWLSRSPRLTDG
jgi:hypothetical protein